VKAARMAFTTGPWPKMPSAERGRLLMKLADLIEENILKIASVESLDNGKSITNAKIDINAAAGCLRYYGGWADKVHGKVIDTQPGTFNYTRNEPIGVCGQIIP
jgi:aldehyde dehydrogenase (NAD+)